METAVAFVTRSRLQSHPASTPASTYEILYPIVAITSLAAFSSSARTDIRSETPVLAVYAI